MIRRAARTGSRALGFVARFVGAVVECASGFLTRAWEHHSDLMQESAPYRQQLGLVITTSLGLLSLHPSFAVLAAALGALYVSAYQRRAEPAYERYSEPERKVGEDLRPRFHDRW